MAKRLAIIGAGISGLAAAHAARSHNDTIEIVVLEKDSQVGGKARSLSFGDWRMEAGPTGFLDNEPILDRLIDAAGLTNQRLPANPSAAHRFLLRNGRLREAHAHPLRFAASGILGPLGLARIAAEPFIPRHPAAEEESVFDFAARRLGTQAAERLIAPMVLGVFAGDARRLSLAAAFPKLAALEQDHGSLIRGMVARRRSGKTEGGPAGPAGWLTSFKEGMQSLPLALAQQGKFEVRTNSTVQTLERRGNQWHIALAGQETLRADALILATEPWAMAEMLDTVHARIAEHLALIPCPAVSVVALGLPKASAQGVPTGFGVLIPRAEGYRALGCLWDSRLFPGRAPQQGLLMRLMYGGSVDPEIAEMDEQALIALAQHEATRLFGIEGPPMFAHAIRWPRAIPQYEIGHLERVGGIEESLHNLPGLYLAGNGLYGIAFGRSAAAGYSAGEEAALYLAD